MVSWWMKDEIQAVITGASVKGQKELFNYILKEKLVFTVKMKLSLD